MNNDLISRSELKETIETWDKFACLPNGILEPFRNLEHPEMFEPYIHFRDVIKAIDNAPTIPLPDFKEGYKQAIRDGKTNFSRPQGEWVGINEYLKHIEESTGEKYKTSGLYNGRLFCNKCWKMSELMIKTNFCYECGAEMREADNDKVN